MSLFRIGSIITIVLRLSLFILILGVLAVCLQLKVLGIFFFFVDDFSRTTWLYLLKGMSKVSGVIETFFNEIKNQFFTSIRVLRTDNT